MAKRGRRSNSERIAYLESEYGEMHMLVNAALDHLDRLQREVSELQKRVSIVENALNDVEKIEEIHHMMYRLFEQCNNSEEVRELKEQFDLMMDLLIGAIVSVAVAVKGLDEKEFYNMKRMLMRELGGDAAEKILKKIEEMDMKIIEESMERCSK